MKLKFLFIITLLINVIETKSQFIVNFWANQTVSCVNWAIDFSSLSSPSNANNWFWDFGDGGTSNVQNPIHYYSNEGVYTVTLIASDGANTDTLARVGYITISQPSPNFSHILNGTTANFTDLSVSNYSNINSWSWDFGDGGTSNLQNPIHTYSLSDTCLNVTLTVIDTVGCFSSLELINDICIFPTLIKQNSAKSVKIYPNPSSSQIHIIGIGKSYELNIYNSSGKLIYNEKNIYSTDKQININRYPNGTLFIEIITDLGVYTHKIIKK